jgi:thiosulfate/3-mercaptopyruvate sulfurtransferase
VVAFKVMGHEKVWVLDGGLPAWIKEDYATEKDRNNYMKR